MSYPSEGNEKIEEEVICLGKNRKSELASSKSPSNKSSHNNSRVESESEQSGAKIEPIPSLSIAEKPKSV